MKRTDQTDDEWEQQLAARKAEAERAMLIADHRKGFITLREITTAATYWRCDKHAAEMRLMRGELPEK